MAPFSWAPFNSFYVVVKGIDVHRRPGVGSTGSAFFIALLIL